MVQRSFDIVRWSLIVIFPLLAMPVALGALQAPRPGEPVLVVAAPWSDGAGEVVARASGREIYPVRAPMAALAIFEDPTLLNAAGAWLVLDGRRIAELCGVTLDIMDRSDV